MDLDTKLVNTVLNTYLRNKFYQKTCFFLLRYNVSRRYRINTISQFKSDGVFDID